MGKVQTVVHVPGDWTPGDLPPMAEILSAYRAGRSVVTDGPFLEITAHPVADPTTVQSVWLLHDHNPTEGIAQEDS